MINQSLMVLCANLRKRQDRRFVLNAIYPKLHLPPIEYLNAVDGELVDDRRLRSYRKNTKKSSYAVRVTKKIALRKFINSKSSHLLFLEDDVWFAPEFRDRLIQAIHVNKEMMFLGGEHHHPPIKMFDIWSKCQFTVHNHCVLFSREGAKKAYDILQNSRAWEWSDRELARQFGSGIEAWCCDPFVAFQRTTLSNNHGRSYKGLGLVPRYCNPDMSPDDFSVLWAAIEEARSVLSYGCIEASVYIANKMKENKGHLTLVDKTSQDWELRPRFAGLPMTGLHSVKNLNEKFDVVLVGGKRRVDTALGSVDLLKKDSYLLMQDFWTKIECRSRIQEMLVEFDYLFESPYTFHHPQGMAVFKLK